jgi:hypothetical protein
MKFFLLLLPLAVPLFGQVYTPPAPQNNSPSTPTDTVVRSQSSQGNTNANGGLFGNEVGVFDPTNDTITWNGETWAASNNRLVSARFEKYLNEPENRTAAADEYRETIEEILQTLSPHREEGPDFLEAVALLPKAATYPGDAKLCDSLSNAIYTAILSRKADKRSKDLVKRMEQEKQRAILDADWKARTDIDPSTGETRQTGENTEAANTPSREQGRGAQSLRYAEHLRRIAEIEAAKKAKEFESKAKVELAKIQYQALMVQFFAQRRFKHVIMASRFYNQIWKEGDGTLYIDEDSDINKIFSDSLGVSPTVSTLDSLANEAIRDVNKGVEVFLFLVEQGELQSASERLFEAYLVGEFMPAINTLPRAKKRMVLEFVRGSNALLNAINAKDFTEARARIEQLGVIAQDFDATKPRSAIAAATRASDMHIAAAKNALISKDNEKAREEIRMAVAQWPQNPKLAEFDRLVDAGTGMIQLRNDFDRLFAEQNYREVYRRRFEFAPSIEGDADRTAKFRQVMENITAIETALKSADEMTKIGEKYAAWEKLAVVQERFPDDPNLNQFIAEIASEVADFTRALAQAEESEENGNLGSALSWFYKAKQLHPRSDRAETGIQRVVQKVLQ